MLNTALIADVRLHPDGPIRIDEENRKVSRLKELLRLSIPNQSLYNRLIFIRITEGGHVWLRLELGESRQQFLPFEETGKYRQMVVSSNGHLVRERQSILEGLYGSLETAQRACYKLDPRVLESRIENSANSADEKIILRAVHDAARGKGSKSITISTQRDTQSFELPNIARLLTLPSNNLVSAKIAKVGKGCAELTDIWNKDGIRLGNKQSAKKELMWNTEIFVGLGKIFFEVVEAGCRINLTVNETRCTFSHAVHSYQLVSYQI